MNKKIALRMKSFFLIALACAQVVATNFLAAVGPCDIYDAAETPCIAAHSMVRALYGSYDGPLYSVLRSSDNASKEIGLVAMGSVADSAAQDTFCKSDICVVKRIFDQSPMGNHLDIAPRGGSTHRWTDRGVNAARSKASIGGNPVYGAYFEGNMGYRNDHTRGVAKGDEPQSIYMVTAGHHYNNGCCFDYGNAETDDKDDGAGTMAAVYWGNWGYDKKTFPWSKGTANGPWVMADLENGLWGGTTLPVNVNNTPIVADFVTAMYKGQAHQFALKGGDAQSGPLQKMYEGRRPDYYDPMKKQGAIILGIGGDNSDAGVGTFYEGVMTSGYASDATDDLVQANIVAAGYGSTVDLVV